MGESGKAVTVLARAYNLSSHRGEVRFLGWLQKMTKQPSLKLHQVTKKPISFPVIDGEETIRKHGALSAFYLLTITPGTSSATAVPWETPCVMIRKTQFEMGPVLQVTISPVTSPIHHFSRKAVWHGIPFKITQQRPLSLEGKALADPLLQLHSEVLPDPQDQHHLGTH